MRNNMDSTEKLAFELLKKDFGEESSIKDYADLWPEYVMEAAQILHEKDVKRGD